MVAGGSAFFVRPHERLKIIVNNTTSENPMKTPRKKTTAVNPGAAALQRENLRLQKIEFKHEATNTTLKNQIAIYEPIARGVIAQKEKEAQKLKSLRDFQGDASALLG